MIKKRASILALILVSFSLFSILVSAADVSTSIMSGISNGISNTLLNGEQFLSSVSSQNNPIFLQILFFILVLLIVVVALDYVPFFSHTKGIKVLVAVIVSFLSVFFLPKDLIASLLSPYQAMGTAFLSIIPFMLLFIFTGKMLKNNFLRATTWFFFSMILLALAITNIVKSNSVISWVYAITSVAAAFMCLFGSWVEDKIWAGKLESAITGARRKETLRETERRLAEERAHNILGSSADRS